MFTWPLMILDKNQLDKLPNRGLGLHVELLLLLLKPDPTSGKQNMSAKEGSRERQGWRRQLLAVTRSHPQLPRGLNAVPHG